MTKIIFLGTAGSSAVTSKQLRASGGIILQSKNIQFHIDPGPGSLNMCQKCGINPHHTTAILISHNHLNHCNDLNIIIDAMTHGGIERRGICLAAKSILHPEKGHPFLTNYHGRLLEKIIPIENKHKIEVGDIEVNTISANHTDPYAVGFKFICPKGIISYTGDTDLTPELLDDLQGTDVLILNVPYKDNKKVGKNLNINEAIEIIKSIQPKIAILTHFGLDILREDPLVAARDVQRETGIQTIAAKDGLVLATEGVEIHKSPIKGYY